MSTGKLFFYAGKMGAGKTTQSMALSKHQNTIRISEDEWLEAIYPNEITNLGEYVDRSNRLKPQIKKLVQSVLLTGTNVVMDFPANTLSQRAWFKGIFSEVNAPHELVYIKASDSECLKRISERKKLEPERANTDTEEMFHAVTKYFVEPSLDEGFVVRIR